MILEDRIMKADIIMNGKLKFLQHYTALPPYTMAFRMPLSRFERFRSHSAEGSMYDIVVVSNRVDQAAGITARLRI
jgi:hypothetical protein